MKSEIVVELRCRKCDPASSSEGSGGLVVSNEAHVSKYVKHGRREKHKAPWERTAWLCWGE